MIAIGIRIAIVLAAALTGLAHAADGAPPLTLETYLKQVESGNLGVKGAAESSAGAELRASEADVLYSPVVFASFQAVNDKKPSAFFPFPQTINNGYTVGIQKQFSFGLQTKLQYGFNYWNYPTFRAPFYEGRPELTLAQPLWRNAFGVETRANHDALEASARAASFSQSFQKKVTLAEAEAAYWRFALANEALDVHTKSLARAQRIHEWSARRARLNLSDPSDLYQAQAALEGTRLRFQAAQDEKRSAGRILNQARGIESDEVSEDVGLIGIDRISELGMPARSGNRDDVRAAEQATRLTMASATASIEKNRPSLDAFAVYAWNSMQPTIGDGLSESLNPDKRSIAFGIKFSAPLDFGATADARAGWRRERDAADLTYQRKLFDQEREWRDLTGRFEDAKRRLKLAKAIEDAQDRKLKHERDRLERGRATTYQVLLFESDYSQSALARIQAQAEVMTLHARLKVFGGAP